MIDSLSIEIVRLVLRESVRRKTKILGLSSEIVWIQGENRNGPIEQSDRVKSKRTNHSNVCFQLFDTQTIKKKTIGVKRPTKRYCNWKEWNRITCGTGIVGAGCACWGRTLAAGWGAAGGVVPGARNTSSRQVGQVCCRWNHDLKQVAWNMWLQGSFLAPKSSVKKKRIVNQPRQKYSS